MRVLLVHNCYGRYSGEEAVVDKMATILGGLGHEVCRYQKTSEGFRDTLSGKVRGFVCGLYSPDGVREMRQVLERERPDVVNIHNLYPFISPAALFECKRKGVPVVMTVHNFRLICPTGMFMRNGVPCEQCLKQGNEWGCIRYNCEQSWLRSIGYAARNAVARRTEAYRKCVDRFACITDFQRQKLAAAGFDETRMTVIPNSVEAPDSYQAVEGNYVAYVGRLSYEKGFDLLAEVARRHPEIPFRLAGSQREGQAVAMPENVTLTGYLTGDALQQFIKDSRMVVLPSRWYEGFPMTILEAACHGKPAIGPRHGGFTEIIGEGGQAIGRLFEPGSVDDLERQVTALWNDKAGCMMLGAKAFRKLKAQYSTEAVSRQWSLLLEDITGKHEHLLQHTF